MQLPLPNPPGLTPAQKIRLAHDAVFHIHPIALAAVAARWKIIEDPNLQPPTFCTNGKTLRYHPGWCNILTLGQVACVVLHEISHVVLGHTFRLAKLVGNAGRRDKQVRQQWNIAADLAINSQLIHDYRRICRPDELEALIAQGTFPQSGDHTDMPAERSAEWYYMELLRNQPPPPPPSPQRSPNGQPEREGGEGRGNGYGDEPDPNAPLGKYLHEGTDEDREGENEKENGNGGKEPKPGEPGDPGDQQPGKDGDQPPAWGDMPGEGDDDEGGDDKQESDGEGGEDQGDGGKASDEEGSGEGSAPAPGEDAGPGDAFGSIEPFDTERPEELEKEEREFQQVMTAAIVTSKSWGVGGGWLETEINSELFPNEGADRMVWKERLRDFLTKICRRGFSFTRPSRRHGWRKDCILPARRGVGDTNGILIVDTSGSMGDEECNVALRELESILSVYPKATVKLISCDTQVMEGPIYTRSDFPITEPVTWQGRGGTDLDPAFLWVAQQPKGTYDWCVILSDMEWWWQDALNPGIPTIWLGCRAGYCREDGTVPVPFGTYIDVVV